MTRLISLTLVALAVSASVASAGSRTEKPTGLTAQIDGITIAGPAEGIKVRDPFASAGGLGTTR